jgi:DTW domain-containing protein YfiP
MTKRILCQHCNRPEKGCICPFITRIDNNTHVVVLQHASEVNQTKGTIALLAKSLTSCQVIVGENFTENAELLQLLTQYQGLLLYPSENAQVLSGIIENPISVDGLTNKALNSTLLSTYSTSSTDSAKPYCLILLDGTWKKAYKMFKLSENLRLLPQVCLPESLANSGQYHIRKVAKKNALSSLEACCYALALIEDSQKYQLFVYKFIVFNTFKMSFRPHEHL